LRVSEKNPEYMRTEVMGSWKKRSQFIFHSRYYKGNRIKNLRRTGHTAQRKAIRNSRKIWPEPPQGGYNLED